MTNVYNPLDKVNLGKSVAEALLDREPVEMDSITSFEGAGIYVIYYCGAFPAYARLAKMNREALVWPIYVGKAIPSGGRKGAALLSTTTGRYLSTRLKEHAESIQLAGNLDLPDFLCRYLAVDDIWIPLGETLLISRFKPVWNLILDGFGNHDPGGGRYNGLRPIWDTLHPGRGWALKCKERSETPGELEHKVKVFLRENPPPTDPKINFAPGASART